MKQSILIVSLLASTASFANDVDPFSFEKEHFGSSLSRAEALEQAKVQRPWYGIRVDDQGRAITSPSTKSRTQVAAETREAARLGLMRTDELGPVQATAEQEQQIKLAGERAANHSAAGE